MFGAEQPILTFRGLLGVRIDIAPSMFLLALLIVGLRFSSLDQVIWSLVIFAIIAGSILLHELGHAWGCRVQGVAVRRIVLHGAGGFCEHAHAANRTQQELIVAMGPIVNLALWAISSLAATGMMVALAASADMPGDWFFDLYWVLGRIAQINLFLAIFNLLPVQPLDGGKLFHLALLRFLDTRQATRVAGQVGVVLCVLWIPAMIGTYYLMGWILFFIPSFRLHLDMAKLRGFGHLKRWD